jgi:hypothetical protein
MDMKRLIHKATLHTREKDKQILLNIEHRESEKNSKLVWVDSSDAKKKEKKGRCISINLIVKKRKKERK